MRTSSEIKEKREKLRKDLANLSQKFRELYNGKRPDEDIESRNTRWKEMDGTKKNIELIKGQIEALTYALNEDFELSELDENLSMRTILHGDWRDDLRG